VLRRGRAHRRRLDAPHLLGAVFNGAKFKNGELAEDARVEERAA
jgi:hypothetical protein